jgi:hypothetical protein
VGKHAKCPQCQQLSVVPAESSALGSDLPSAANSGPAAPKPPEPKPPASAFGPPPSSDNPYATSALPQYGATPVGNDGAITNTTVDVSDIFNHSWECFQRDFGVLFLAQLVAGIAPLIPLIPIGILFFAATMAAGGDASVGLLLIVGIPCVLIALLLSTYLMLGQMDLALASARRQRVEIGMIFYRGGNSISAMFCLLAFNMVVSVLVIFFCLGFVILLFYWPLGFLLVDKKVSLGEASGLARKITANNAGTAILLAIICVAISFAASMICQLIVYLVTPFFVLAWATAYLTMSGQLPVGQRR